MTKDEKTFLNEASIGIDEFAKKHPTFDSFYSNIGLLKLPRIQDLSFDNDLKYFNEVGRVLSFIYSISQRPYIATKTNDLIVRSDVAAQLNETDRLMTFQDTSIWKRKGNGISPEYVHYHEYVDQLAIYENIFIVYLLNLISDDLIKYQVFYVSTLNKYDFKNTDLSIDQTKQEEAVKVLNRLLSIVSRLKDTHFYKEVSRVKTKMGGQIVPTNILMQNPLYRRCYIFYEDFISSVDYEKINSELSAYYYVLILSNLKERKYKFEEKDFLIYQKTHGFVIPKEVKLTSKEIDIRLNYLPSQNGHYFLMTNLFKRENISYRNGLCVLSDTYHAPIPNDKLKNEIDSFSYLTIWNLSILNSDDELDLLYNMHPEIDLVNRFIESHSSIISGNKDIYSRYCPICQKNSVRQNENGLYTCEHCHSTYYLDRTSLENDTKITLLDIRSNA